VFHSGTAGCKRFSHGSAAAHGCRCGRGAALETLRRIGAHLKSDYGGTISLQLFSALKRSGIDEAHAVLDGWLEPLPPNTG
jgi:predicted NBD/HSP70 family sugar kinase